MFTRISVFVIIISAMFFAGCGNGTSSAGDTRQNPGVNKASHDSQQVKLIVFFGNSLTAGYGLDPSEAFPSLIQRKIDSSGLLYKVTNAGLSGETSAGGRSRIDWLLRQKIDVFVLELGGNDGLRGIP